MSIKLTENIKHALFSSKQSRRRLLEADPAGPAPDYYSFDELSSYEEAKTPLTVICGVENFQALYSLRDHLRRNTAVLVEPDHGRLRHLFENFDLSGILEEYNVYIVSGEDVKHLGDSIEQYFTIALTTEVFTIPPVENRKEEFDEGLENLTSFRQTSRSNQETIEKFLTEWYVYFARNLSDYLQVRPLSRLRGGLEGQTCSVIGPGPTLDHQLELLEQLSTGWTIAVDTALPLLNDLEIVPDFVISVDAGEDNLEYLQNIPSESTLVCPAYMNPDVLELTDNLYIFEPNFPPAIWLQPEFDSPGLLAMSGSVSTTAIDMAKLLAPENCFMLGVDLSYPDLLAFSRHHPKYKEFVGNLDRFTTLPEQNLDKIREKETEVANCNGQKILTSELFLNWKSFFEYLIENADFPIHRTSEGVLPLDATKPLPELDEINVSPKQPLKKEGKEPETDRDELAEKLKKLRDQLNELQPELQVIDSLARRDKDISRQWLDFTRKLSQNEEVVSYFQWAISRLTKGLRDLSPDNQSETFHQQFQRWKKLISATREGLEEGLDQL